MKVISIATAVVALLGAIVGLFTSMFSKERPHPPPQSVTLSVSGNSNQVNGATTVNGASVVNISNSFSGGNSEGEKATKAGSVLVGRWKVTTKQVLPAFEITADGYMQLQQSGAYSFSGDFTMRRRDLSGNVEAAVWTVAETGAWNSISDGKYSISSADLKSLRTVLHLRDKTSIDVERVAALAPPGMPLVPRYRLEDLLPKGASQEYLINELTGTTLRATAQDMRGVRVEVVASRQS